MLVVLTDDEMSRAEAVAEQRFEAFNRPGREHRDTMIHHRHPATLYHLNLKGAVAELAVAKMTGLAWSSEHGIGAADVGDYIEVRYATDQRNLIIRQGEFNKPANTIFVLVHGNTETHDYRAVTVVGWIRLHEAMIIGRPYRNGNANMIIVHQNLLYCDQGIPQS
jgi:hypothetical protein